MSLLVDLLAALPAGAAEAVTARGLDDLIALLRGRGNQVDEDLAGDLTAISEGRDPRRPVEDIANELSGVVQELLISEWRSDVAIHQEGGDESSQLAIGRDLHLHSPHRPHQQ